VKDMKVAELMTSNVKTCGQGDSLDKGARIMWDNDCGCLPVVDQDNRIVGILTDRDIAMAAYAQGLPLHAMRAEDAMTRVVVSCSPDDEIGTAEEMMRQNKVRRIPVTDSDRRPVGILSLNDLAREAARELSSASPTMTGEEIATTLGAVGAPRAHVLAQFQFGPEPGEVEYRPGPPPKRGVLRK
jgi:CBS domain-containing protein